jgi:UDP-3-O-[3-hydroxymyristoyl] glucosamine N-acyltransferase
MLKDDKINLIGRSSEIGENFKIGYRNFIGQNVTIGKNVTMGDYNIIKDNVTIGDNTKIENFVLLKSGTVIGDNCYVDSYVKSSGDNTIGNRVTLRFNATIARLVVIEDDVFISPNVMTIYVKHTGEHSKGTLIKSRSFLGTNAVIGPDVVVGEDVIIGAQAYVSKSCLDPGTYVGVPAILLRKG